MNCQLVAFKSIEKYFLSQFQTFLITQVCEKRTFFCLLKYSIFILSKLHRLLQKTFWLRKRILILREKAMYPFVQRVIMQMNRKAILLNSFLDFCNHSKAGTKLFISFLLNEHQNMGKLYIINVIWVMLYGKLYLVSKTVWESSSCTEVIRKWVFSSICYLLIVTDCYRRDRASIFIECTKIYLEVTVKNSGMLVRKCEGIPCESLFT